jgi:acyl-coenzyme A thioesterase PaaI-like protein
VFEFDRATALSGGGPVFETALGADWNGRGNAHGGFMLALVTRALGRVMPFPDPIAVSGFFLRPGSAGPVRISTEVIRSGKTTGFGQASLWRDGKELLRTTAAFADLAVAAARGGPSYSGGAAPDLPPPEECVPLIPARRLARIPLTEHFEYRVPALPSWAVGAPPSGNPVYELWMRFADGREPDVASLPLIVDAVAPTVLEVGAGSTTVELTVHVRARPAPGWLACRSYSRHVADGYHEEDFEVWDSTGKLVAQSRQLALVLT